MPRIHYSAANFASGTFPWQLSGTHDVPLARLVWAAVTIGRTPFSRPAPLPDAAFELAWRGCMVLANLTQAGHQYARSTAYDRLDGSEKGAVSFFLGQVQAKVFAEDAFGVSVFAHLDSVLSLTHRPRRRTRPDFVGYDSSRRVALSVEAKGRTRGYTAQLRRTAKRQARALPGVVGHARITYAHIAFCESDGTWGALLDDPPTTKSATDVDSRDVLLGYYLPLVDALVLARQRREPFDTSDDTITGTFPESGIEVTAPRLLVATLARVERAPDGRVLDIDEARDRASSLLEMLPARADFDMTERSELPRHESDPMEYTGGDGITVRLDSSWREWAEPYRRN